MSSRREQAGRSHLQLELKVLHLLIRTAHQLVLLLDLPLQRLDHLQVLRPRGARVVTALQLGKLLLRRRQLRLQRGLRALELAR